MKNSDNLEPDKKLDQPLENAPSIEKEDNRPSLAKSILSHTGKFISIGAKYGIGHKIPARERVQKVIANSNIKSIFGDLRGNLSNYVTDLKQFKDDFKSNLPGMIEKAKHPAINNFELGVKYLEEGHVRDAILRFWLAERFKENFTTATYYLGYSYYVHGKIKKAKKTLSKIQHNKKAAELLDVINQAHKDDIPSKFAKFNPLPYLSWAFEKIMLLLFKIGIVIYNGIMYLRYKFGKKKPEVNNAPYPTEETI